MRRVRVIWEDSEAVDSARCAVGQRLIRQGQLGTRPCPCTPGPTISCVGLPEPFGTARPPQGPPVPPHPHPVLLPVSSRAAIPLHSRFCKQLSSNLDFYFHIVSELPYARPFLHCLSFAAVTSRMVWYTIRKCSVPTIFIGGGEVGGGLCLRYVSPRRCCTAEIVTLNCLSDCLPHDISCIQRTN